MKRNSNVVAEIVEKRARNVKHYIKEDFSYEAAIYPNPVHYLDGGIWKDINNNFEDSTDEENNKVLENKENDFKLRIAKKSKAKKLIRVKKGEYELSWGIDNANDVPYEISDVNNSNLNQLPENDRKKALKDISSSPIRFRNIFENIDFEYLVISEKVKENIIINSSSPVSQFVFNLNLSRLLPRLEADRSIVFYDSKDNSSVVFRMPAPFMYDASGAQTSNVKVELRNNKNSYELVVTPDAAWVNDNSRTYPLIIDPIIETSLDTTKIYDAFVSLFAPNENYRDSVLLDVGQSPINKVARSYIKFELPELTSADMVIDAELSLSLFEANASVNQINAHKVLGNWESSTITWNNAPNFDSKIDDYNNLSGVVGNRFSWEITDIVKEWYTIGNNYGVVIKHNNEQSGYNKFYSSDTHIDYAAYRPRVSITYVNNSGLESYWTYHYQDLGRAGISYINDYNGNLIHIHNDINTNGKKMPLTLNHIFNSNLKDINIGYGLGWRLSLNQTVKYRKIGNRDYYEYVDEDGTIHYFSYDSASGVYRDESSIDLTLTKNADGTFSMNDKGGNLLTFNASGYLISMRDNNNNTLTISYSGAKIQNVTNGSGRVTTFTYDVSGNLAAITDPAGRKTNYSYSGQRLWRITYVDAKYSEFNYDLNNKLTSAINIDGYRVSFSYYDAPPFRVKSVQEGNVDGTLGQELNITYGNNTTIFTDFTGRKNIYQFNDNGNTVSVIDSDGRSQYFRYNEGIDDRNKNRLRLQSKL